jgi:hypothetical protein
LLAIFLLTLYVLNDACLWNLVIYDGYNSNCQFNAYFPAAYNREGIERIVQRKQSCTNFYGATANINFLVREYEVFRVLFQ